MKSHYFLSLLPCLSSGVQAFPAYMNGPISDAVASRLSDKLAGAFHEVHKKRLLFDPLTAPIDVTGDHEFIAPDFENGDQRGPCPGLNALANHGYIARNGVTSLVEVTAGINTIFGMGIDIASILAVMGTVFVGNPLSLNPGFSIGYESSGSQNILGNVLGLLGTPRGLNGSHNIIEGDSSLTRGDLYMTGDATTMVMDQFQTFYDMSSGEGDYNLDVFGARAAARFNETIATNPNFYYGPFTGMIARNAGYLFACRMFANHSAENPTGLLNKETLKSFFAVQGEEGNLTYNKGWERIPDNWYRTPVDYGLVQLNLDLVSWVLKYPELGSIGGNMGEVNSFAGVNLGDLTGGVLNLTKLLENNNLLCFVFEILKTASPNSLSTLFSIIEVPLKLVTDAVGAAVLNLACPAFKDMMVGGKSFEDGIKDQYPGAKLSGNVL
ncbi:Dothistromin biosynthesis peroxidase dotB [Colletotrichum sp. SAR 10_70]|nr:Dothistromin biosynthesis peroxidase dotB [Colletotrichum sp. SAR 10_71]KAI8189244.1 Dothistromin biosynthesis peroxidase dotB [Colletotrichum sp. SAR 10_75]KAI8201783.1 Dothistromin biosynthesis peroxidase dotB [Colletotrichum sp. SAR 10_70]KAI8236286.1 Dothistromin biosynthesis peroxidase dotB [Colletotrichum sp. SAR 10_86]KAI8250328.1 Dothistromin biosynthesis peroxidase dotB [Colletotrichum sp. SAR 10_77]